MGMQYDRGPDRYFINNSKYFENFYLLSYVYINYIKLIFSAK